MSGLPHSRTPLIGRHDEIETASAILRAGEAPLLTITGPGGVRPIEKPAGRGEALHGQAMPQRKARVL